MNKKIFLFLFLGLFLCFSHIAYASVKINEFVSHPISGEKEWVEILNTEGEKLDGWKLTEFSSPNTEPKENILIDLSTFSGNIIFIEVGTSKLNDSGDSIGLYNNNILIDRVTYGKVNGYSANLSEPSQGKSGAIISGQWKTNQNPTKGENNSNDNSIIEENNNIIEDDSSDSDSSSSDSSNKTTIIPVLKLNILAPSLAFSGQPIVLNSEVKYGELTYMTGKYFWNFGDGTSFENISGFQKFTHIYYYPGEYVVSLDYSKNKNSIEPDVRDEMIVKVIPLTISISKVGDEKDFFIELTNNADSKIDISKWYLASNNKYFSFPKNTIILPKKSMVLSPKITNFTKIDEGNLKLYSSINELVFDYNPIIKKSIINTKKVSKNNYVPANNISLLSSSILEQNSDADFILTPDLSINEVNKASSIDSFNSLKNNNGNSLYFWIFVFLIIISIFMVLFLRKNREEEKIIGDDFEILDE